MKAGWDLSVFKNRSPHLMKTLYKLLIRSHLEYGCPVWNVLSKQEVQSIETVQRSFTDKIKYPFNISDYWQRLKYLNLMSLQRRHERYLVMLMLETYQLKNK